MSVEGHKHWTTADMQTLAPGLTLKPDLQNFRGVLLRTVPPQNGKCREILFPSLPVAFTSHLFIVVILGVG